MKEEEKASVQAEQSCALGKETDEDKESSSRSLDRSYKILGERTSSQELRRLEHQQQGKNNNKEWTSQWKDAKETLFLFHILKNFKNVSHMWIS